MRGLLSFELQNVKGLVGFFGNWTWRVSLILVPIVSVCQFIHLVLNLTQFKDMLQILSNSFQYSLKYSSTSVTRAYSITKSNENLDLSLNCEGYQTTFVKLS